MLLFLFTHKWLRSKLSNAILTLKYFLSVSDINGVKQLLQMSHGLCVIKCNAETNIQTYYTHHSAELVSMQLYRLYADVCTSQCRAGQHAAILTVIHIQSDCMWM